MKVSCRGGIPRTKNLWLICPRSPILKPMTAQPIPTSLSLPPELQDLSIFDDSNKFSLINLVPKEFAEYVKRIPLEIMTLSEKEFIERYAPDEIDYRLKLKFWDEWQLALLTPGGVVRLPSVYYGICPREYFYHKIIKDQARLAWMITPPVDYEIAMREILYKGMSRLREIIQLPFIKKEPIIHRGQPVIGPDGKPMHRETVDRGIVSEIRQVITLLADRVHGAIIQRVQVQQKSVNLSLSATVDPNDPLPSIGTDELQNIDKQLDLLEEKIRPFEIASSRQDETIDITPEFKEKLEEYGIDPEAITEKDIPGTRPPSQATTGGKEI
jgi:hypothetical protein